MTNLKSKSSRIPAGRKPGITPSNFLEKLKAIPGIEITKFKSYQHRTKEWRGAGYSGSVADNGQVHLHKNYNVYIKGFPAWRIGFKNNCQSTVDILMHFSVHDKYGLQETFTKSYTNLRPGEPAEMFVMQDKKRTQVKLETVEIYTGSQLLSSTEIGAFLPPKTWNLLASFLLVFCMGIYAASIAGNHKEIPDHKAAAVVLSLFAFFISIWELFNITAVMFMFLLLLMVLFSLSDRGEITILLSLGVLYLWSVWKKRYSIKDFLIGAFTAKSS
jgi:hypothetical protein